MFTGIVHHVGEVKAIVRNRYTFSAPQTFFRNLHAGSSVAINGMCVTLESDPRKRRFSIEVMPETKRRTTVETLRVGDRVNLERSLSTKGFFDGHIIQGHVDDTAVVSSIKSEGNAKIFTFTADKKLLRYLVEKGSVAINGVSLTVMNSKQNSFAVGIIPHTLRTTALTFLRRGDTVNIEVDILAKYVEKCMRKISV